MVFTLSASPFSTTSLTPFLSPSHRTSFFNLHSSAPKHRCCRRPQIRRFSIKSSHNKPPDPSRPLTLIRFLDSSSISTFPKGKQQNPAPHHNDKNNYVLERIAKPFVLTLFCIAISFCPVRYGFQLQAIAATPLAAMVGEGALKRTKRKAKYVEVLKHKDHEYSDCTRRLLGTVSGLLKSIEEFRSGNGDLKSVEAALREVKSKKRELQNEIMDGLYVELRELKGEKDKLVKKSEAILDSVLKTKREQENLLKKLGGRRDGEDTKARIAKFEEEMQSSEKEYNRIWEKVGEIDDRILRRETMALSIGIREISFIERESELLVQNFRRELRRQSNER